MWREEMNKFCNAVGIQIINGKISMVMPFYVLDRFIGVFNNTIDIDVAIKECLVYVNEYTKYLIDRRCKHETNMDI